VNSCPHVLHCRHDESELLELLELLDAASWTMHATCASPDGPRHAHPRWIGGGAPSQHIVHTGDVSASAPNPVFFVFVFVPLLFARRVALEFSAPILCGIHNSHPPFSQNGLFCFGGVFFCLPFVLFYPPSPKKGKEPEKKRDPRFFVLFHFWAFHSYQPLRWRLCSWAGIRNSTSSSRTTRSTPT
jgi:hypothetical protein